MTDPANTTEPAASDSNDDRTATTPRGPADSIWIGDLEDVLDKIRLAIQITDEQLAATADPDERDKPTAPAVPIVRLYLDTLARFVRAAGGTLSITVTFPGLPPIELIPPATNAN